MRKNGRKIFPTRKSLKIFSGRKKQTNGIGLAGIAVHDAYQGRVYAEQTTNGWYTQRADEIRRNDLHRRHLFSPKPGGAFTTDVWAFYNVSRHTMFSCTCVENTKYIYIFLKKTLRICFLNLGNREFRI